MLADIHGVRVESRRHDHGAFLVLECEPSQALTMYEMIMMVDADAELIHSTSGEGLNPLVRPEPEPV